MLANYQFFTQKLLEWAATAHRPLAWKGEKNPYFIWLSEILLQQTRAEQGLPYYERFKAAFPTIVDLANAPEDEVFKLWQGLGYYQRARNLHFTAKYITDTYKGVFPNTYDEIRALKGVGDYTAAAIASFGFDLPYAVLDGNVYRVLSRFFGIEKAIDEPKNKKEFAELAQNLLDKNAPAAYNQAIMDFGATHCKPKNPLCGTCLHKEKCVAFASQKQHILPIKAKKIQRKERYFYYFIYHFNDKIILKKRAGQDIWQGLYDFPMLELDSLQDKENLLQLADFQNYVTDFSNIKNISQPTSQQLTHQKIVAVFIEIHLDKMLNFADNEYIWVDFAARQNYAYPKIVSDYWADKTLTLF